MTDLVAYAQEVSYLREQSPPLPWWAWLRRRRYRAPRDRLAIKHRLPYSQQVDGWPNTTTRSRGYSEGVGTAEGVRRDIEARRAARQARRDADALAMIEARGKADPRDLDALAYFRSDVDPEDVGRPYLPKPRPSTMHKGNR
jgi:hypothetical protein